MLLEILDFALMLLRGGLGVESAEILAFPVVTLLARIEPVFPGFELAYHDRLLRNMNAR
jgi:hypothetical protein